MREFIVVLLVACALLGCKANTPKEPPAGAAAAASKPAKQSKTVGAELTGYNHTDQYISAFYVNGQGGGNIFAGTGGGSFVCCAELPVPWYPGLTAKVTWEDHEGKMQAREVLVPEYDPKKLSTFNVHFLRSGEIKVFAVRMTLRHRDYPLKGPESELNPGVAIEKVY